jgi:hypothetical protein
VIETHAPVPAVHDWQTPLHEELPQQTPLLHTPELHCAFVVHVPPALVSPVQVPVASQNAAPVQLSGSGPFVTVVHVPLPDAHAEHVAVHVAAEQQKPLLQTPIVHCAFVVHAPPGAVCATQPPPALQ